MEGTIDTLILIAAGAALVGLLYLQVWWWPEARWQKRLRQLAAKTCPECGTPVGLPGAEKAYAAEVERVRAAHELQTDPTNYLAVHFACATCKLPLRYHPEGNALAHESPAERQDSARSSTGSPVAGS